jgi:hypothetical protein
MMHVNIDRIPAHIKVTGNVGGIPFESGLLILKGSIERTTQDGFSAPVTDCPDRLISVDAELVVQNLSGALMPPYEYNANLLDPDNNNLECKVYLQELSQSSEKCFGIIGSIKNIDVHSLFGFPQP